MANKAAHGNYAVRESIRNSQSHLPDIVAVPEATARWRHPPEAEVQVRILPAALKNMGNINS